MEATRSFSPSASRRRKPLPAFYQPSSSSTSAQIMAEARQSLRVLPTERPFTPTDSDRILFGNKTSRPPSVYSIGARHFSESRPSTAQRLLPIESTLSAQQIEIPHLKPTPPTPVQSTCLLPQSHSLTVLERNEYSSEVPIPRPPSHRPGIRPNQSTCPEPQPSQRSPVVGRRGVSAGHVPKAREIVGDRALQHEGREQGSVQGGGGRRGSRSRERGRGGGGDEAAPGRLERRRGSEPPLMTGAHPQSQTMEHAAVKKKKSEAPLFWQTEISPLLSQLSSSSSSSALGPEALRLTVDQLFVRLRERECFGRSGGAAGVKQRSAVLRAIFSLLDSTDPSLLMKLAKIILAMEVTGKNLLNVCKLLFSLARTDSNDLFFTEEAIAAPLLGLLGTCDAVSDSDALVYGLGTVKLLASNRELRVQLAESDVLHLLSSLLDTYCKGSHEAAYLTSIQNVLVQLTAALRNLSEHAALRPAFLSSGLLPLLAHTLSAHLSHPDITFNITRLLSKLTLHPECCSAVLQCPPFLPLFLHSLTIHQSHPDILVRVCFILGNLTTEDQETRRELFSTHHALPPLTSLTASCVAAEMAQVNADVSKTEKSKNEELLIKLIRLLANLSVHADVGSCVASDKASVDQLMEILRSLPLSGYRELTVNTLATLNNLSYYASQDSYLVLNQQELSRLLVRILLEDDSEPLLECIRCYGNLSRHPAVRHTIRETKVDELLVTLLDSKHYELVHVSCGVLVNLMADSVHRDTLTSCGGVGKLIDVLRDFGHSDWQLASLVCQTLWNFSEGMTSASSCFGEEEAQRLINLLQTFCDLQELADTEANWRDHFLPVGTSLLGRVFSRHTSLIPLDDEHS